MSSGHSYDEMLQIALERFRSLMAPSSSSALTTKALPPDVEQDPKLLCFVYMLFEQLGIVFGDTTQPTIRLFKHSMAVDFIKTIKDERPDFVDFVMNDAFETVPPELEAKFKEMVQYHLEYIHTTIAQQQQQQQPEEAEKKKKKKKRNKKKTN
ncbi:hypothetical protein BGX28_000172, partial [Mortierella sp. GBA30]